VIQGTSLVFPRQLRALDLERTLPAVGRDSDLYVRGQPGDSVAAQPEPESTELTEGQGRAMKQIQIVKRPRRLGLPPLDLRTPSGRVLPY
jgi:hypothetical protein